MEWYEPKAGPPIAGAPVKIGAARQPDKFSGSNQLAGIQPGQRGAFGNTRGHKCRVKSGMTKVWKRPIVDMKGYPSVKSVPHLLQVAAGHGTLQPNPRMKTERPHCGQEMSKLLRPK